jgi:hypothetical protein
MEIMAMLEMMANMSIIAVTEMHSVTDMIAMIALIALIAGFPGMRAGGPLPCPVSLCVDFGSFQSIRRFPTTH